MNLHHWQGWVAGSSLRWAMNYLREENPKTTLVVRFTKSLRNILCKIDAIASSLGLNCLFMRVNQAKEAPKGLTDKS
jgi:hypothetical protein